MTVPRPDVTRDGAPASTNPALAAAQAAHARGFTGDRLITAVAIAGAESRWNRNAHCLNCAPGVREDSRGLWQINVDAHPQYAAVNLYDPITNAGAMDAISGGGRNWHPWSTFTSGAYLAYMPQARDAAALVNGSAPTTDLAGHTNTVPAPVHQVFPSITDAQWASWSLTHQRQVAYDAAVAIANQASVDADKAANAGIYGLLNGLPKLSVSDFVSLLASSGTWRRVLFVVLGLAFLVIGAFLLDRSLLNQVAGTAVTSAAGAVAGRV